MKFFFANKTQAHMQQPLVSVIMPVYNSSKHLTEAIDSILNQTYENFEFHIFNDGSSDNSHEIITGYTDKRIIYHNFQENSGYVKHLNEGIQASKGKYIARMDSDDISYPERFFKQVQYLEESPNVSVCGSSFQFIGNAKSIRTLPETNDDIRIGLITSCIISHPSVMLRRETLLRNSISYSEEVAPAEDYYMWCSLSSFTKFYNFPQPLIKYRAHENQISQYKKEKQDIGANKARAMYLRNNGFVLEDHESDALSKVVEYKNEDIAPSLFQAIYSAMNKIYLQNKNLNFFNEQKLVENFNNYWEDLPNRITQFSPQFIKPLILTTKQFDNNFSAKVKAVHLVKSLVSWKTRV